MNRLALAAALFFAASAIGCTPAIGDECEISTDCSQLGDRLCDTTQPLGYCTIFNCEPDTCPDSLCVGFNFQLDPACGTADDGRWGRFERTFCMAPCDDDSDCRDGYICIAPGDRNARIVDQNPINSKVCATNSSLPDPSLPNGTPGVCEAGDPGTPWTPYDPSSSSSSSASSKSSSSQ